MPSPAFSSNSILLAGSLLLPGSAPHRGAAAGIGGAPKLRLESASPAGRATDLRVLESKKICWGEA
jgi:hypothetical protein